MKQGIVTILKQTVQAPLWQGRSQAGSELALLLVASPGPWHCDPRDVASASQPALVLALPRGGVPVAAQIAEQLGLPLATWSVRKLTRPEDPEYALGAVAAGETIVWNESEPWLQRLHASEREAMVGAQQNELERRQKTYGDPPIGAVRGRDILVVDDGVATGLTARAALESLRRAGARSLTFATPVLDRLVSNILLQHCNQIVTLAIVTNLISVGRWYIDFPQLEDKEVLALLGPRLRAQP